MDKKKQIKDLMAKHEEKSKLRKQILKELKSERKVYHQKCIAANPAALAQHQGPLLDKYMEEKKARDVECNKLTAELATLREQLPMLRKDLS